MKRRSIVPTSMQSYYSDWHFSPAVISNGLVFVSGCTAEKSDESISTDLSTQFRQAFDNVNTVLIEAGLDISDVVEMTTYHIGLKQHLDLFMKIKDEYVYKPYPAWTAIGISELASEGIIEIRVIARQR